MNTVRIAVIGEYNPGAETHVATNEAIGHVSAVLREEIVGKWISSRDISTEDLAEYDGLWVAPGPPHLVVENSLKAIRHARESAIPTFGNCGGFQLIAVEIARSILGIVGAHHEEYMPSAPTRVVIPMSCSLRGQELPINISTSSLTGELYKRTRVIERYYCRFGINPEFRSQFLLAPIVVSGRDDDGEIRAFELAGHPFFLATLFVPQAKASPEVPHPLVRGFFRACMVRRDARAFPEINAELEKHYIYS